MKRKVVISIEIISTILTITGCIYIRNTHGKASILWCLIPAAISFATGWIREKLKKS